MKILKYLLFLLLILVIGTAIYIAVQPNEYQFSRSKIIDAPAAVLFNKVNDFQQWDEFSPWTEMEPSAEITYGDKTQGVGAAYNWHGEELGIGGMKTIDANPYKSIDQKLMFKEPMEAESNIHWTFEPVEGGTKVTWSMDGKQDFKTKAVTTLMGSIEETTASSFERGLAKLDSVTTAEISEYSITKNGITEYSGGYYLYTTASTRIDNLANKIEELMPKVGAFAVQNNISMDGAPFLIYHEWDEQNNAVRFSACVPTTSRIITTDPDILTGQLQPFKALKFTLKGNYSNLQEAWNQARAAVDTDTTLTLSQDGPQLEVYVTDPVENPNPANWITELYLAIEEL